MDVLVCTCTGGERGDVLNPAMDRPGVLENMAEIRRGEMAEAAAILGVEHRWLGFDSGLPGEGSRCRRAASPSRTWRSPRRRWWRRCGSSGRT
nr:hypothetical protein GCM10020093_061650 [Planobispora longispora]